MQQCAGFQCIPHRDTVQQWMAGVKLCGLPRVARKQAVAPAQEQGAPRQALVLCDRSCPGRRRHRPRRHVLGTEAKRIAELWVCASDKQRMRRCLLAGRGRHMQRRVACGVACIDVHALRSASLTARVQAARVAQTHVCLAMKISMCFQAALHACQRCWKGEGLWGVCEPCATAA